MTPQKRCEEMAGTQYAIGRLALSGGGGRVHRTLECGAVPIGEAGAGCVRALTKVKQRSAGRRGGAHVVIHEKKFAKLLVIKSGFRKDLGLREALQLRRHVGIERRTFDFSAAGPEADAAHFVGVSFAGDTVGARALGGQAAGKASHREVEAAPEKVHRAAFADEARPELVEDTIDGDEDLPEFADGLGIVRGVDAVFVKGNGIWYFHGHSPDFDPDSRGLQQRKEFAIEVRDGARQEREGPHQTIVCLEPERVVKEIELNLKDAFAARNRCSGQAPCIHIQGDVPPVIYQRRKPEANLADDLGVHVKRGVRIFPSLQGKRRPAFRKVAQAGRIGFAHFGTPGFHCWCAERKDEA